jgi:hypothetical protein
MKKTFLAKAFVSLIAVVALCSCNKDDNNNGGGGTPDVIINNTITAKVDDGSSYNSQIDSVNVTIANNVYKTAKSVYNNGEFKLTLQTVNDSLLHLLSDSTFTPRGVTVSDTTAKVVDAFIYANKSDKQAGSFYYGTTEWPGQLMYANKNVTVSGSGSIGNKTNKYTNVRLEQGWNMVYRKESASAGKHEVEITTQTPNGAKWYYKNN